MSSDDEESLPPARSSPNPHSPASYPPLARLPPPARSSPTSRSLISHLPLARLPPPTSSSPTSRLLVYLLACPCQRTKLPTTPLLGPAQKTYVGETEPFTSLGDWNEYPPSARDVSRRGRLSCTTLGYYSLCDHRATTMQGVSSKPAPRFEHISSHPPVRLLPSLSRFNVRLR